MHGNKWAAWVTEVVSIQGVPKLDKSDILKAVMDKIVRDKELEWEINPHIQRIKEMGVKHEEISSLCGQK